MSASFCVAAQNEALAKYGRPEIMKTNQESQFTGSAWITARTMADIKICIVGRDRYLDTILIKRLWRSLKQKTVYLHELQDGIQKTRITVRARYTITVSIALLSLSTISSTWASSMI